MKIRHPEKLMKITLAKTLVANSWKDANYKISNLRTQIKNSIKQYVKDAKAGYLLRKQNSHR